MLKFLQQTSMSLLGLILYGNKIQPRMKINLGVNNYPINISSPVSMFEGKTNACCIFLMLIFYLLTKRYILVGTNHTNSIAGYSPR